MRKVYEWRQMLFIKYSCKELFNMLDHANLNDRDINLTDNITFFNYLNIWITLNDDVILCDEFDIMRMCIICMHIQTDNIHEQIELIVDWIFCISHL